MSRCFPFPPPGYEKKARTDDLDILKKEEQKEKKHKKEKDKEKRENKEKKEKDRREGKHKDKKDKKEKHKDRDKKKEKDRDKEKDKDRSSNSEEKKFPYHPEDQNGEKTSDEKKLPGKSGGHGGEKFAQKEKVRDKDRSSFSSEKKLAGQFSGYNGEKISQKSHPAEDIGDSKFVQELGRRVRDEGAGAANQLVDKFMGRDQERDEGMVRLVAKTANKLVEEKERNKRSDDNKMDVQGTREETRYAGSAMVQNLSGAVKARVEGIPRQMENNTERRGEGREKPKEKETDDKIRDKRKDKDREKKGHRKDKDRDKEKEEEKPKGVHRNLEQNNLKGSNKDGPMVSINLRTSHASKEGNKDAATEENLRKRKDLEKNGFVHVNDIKPNKLLRTTSSSHPMMMDNGKTMESCQAPVPLTSDSQGAETSLKGGYLPPGTTLLIHSKHTRCHKGGPMSVPLKGRCISLCNSYFHCLKLRKLFLIENVRETSCGLCNSTAILICNIELLFTRNVR
ncbi:hypothetical protein PTKIN_Ptkin17bG0048500 [Pterospermum kingtungense]